MATVLLTIPMKTFFPPNLDLCQNCRRRNPGDHEHVCNQFVSFFGGARQENMGLVHATGKHDYSSIITNWPTSYSSFFDKFQVVILLK